ncbi:hypothetical protein RP20_CCG027586 [Aedes albopictus]|nr:hypothetical protein RP20_CCG013344 [Aedes albopictus]KXJ79822.1 hypothetical protein RP20_CCG027586 [Aedes albopictus]
MKAVSSANGHRNVIILTDSASCLDALREGRSNHPWIQSIEKAIERQNIILCWVPGHSGITGNDKADELAKQGRNQPQMDISLPAQDAVREIRRRIWMTWESEWHQNRCHLRQIKLTPTQYPDRKCSSEQRVLTRIRIGHTRLTHAHLMNNSDPPMCTYCGYQVTVQHILTECRGLQQYRTNCGINGSLSEILAYDNEAEKAVIKFLKESKLFDKI